jgi:hypothetical protein
MYAGREIPTDWTTVNRETIAYHYYGPVNTGPIKDFNALYHRGYVASVNDIFIDKRVYPTLIEYDGSTVSNDELQAAFGYNQSSEEVPETRSQSTHPCFLERGSNSKTYWNSWRPRVYEDNDPVDNSTLFLHNVTQQMIDEYRNQAENINKSDAEIIAELRGTRQAKENECHVIGYDSIDIDLSVQPQTSDGPNLRLGEEGAISYTFFDTDLVTHKYKHNKDGIIHIFYQATLVDNGIYIQCQNREVFKSEWQEFYRPSLEVLKDDVLYTREINRDVGSENIVGYKPRFSEYFRMPCFIRGDFDPQHPVRVPGLALVGVAGNASGWYARSLQGNDAISLPSLADWIGLRNTLEESSLSMLGIDTTDTSIRRLMIIDGGTLSTQLWRRRTNQVFYLFGNVEININQPISEKVKRRFIKYGEQ